MPRALVVDPDETARTALCSLLPSIGLEVTACADAADALEALERAPVAVVVAEVELPGTGGYELCRTIRERFGETIAVVLTSAERTTAGDRTVGLMLGADDYLAKPVDWAELLARLQRLLARSGAAGDGAPTLTPAADGLTPREREVLRLLAEGRGQDEICAELVIAPKTVSAHIERILAKVGARSRAQAVAIAYRDGLVRPPR